MNKMFFFILGLANYKDIHRYMNNGFIEGKTLVQFCSVIRKMDNFFYQK